MDRTLEVAVPAELEAEIAAAVASGEYESEGDAIRGALAEWRAQRLSETLQPDELRTLWREGIESGPGRSLSVDDIKAEARRRFSKR